MAIGDYGTNNNSKQNNGVFESTCYSRYKFRNDTQSLNMTYHSGLLCLDLGEFETENSFKTVSKIKIYLSPIKALMLAEQIDTFIDYRDNTKKIDDKVAFGVNAGMGEKVSYIGFSTNANKENIITIGKFDKEGVIIESETYKFKSDYNAVLDWTDIKANELTKVYKNDMELIMLKNTLIDFGRSMSGALGYSVLDTARYDNGRNFARMDMVLDKLGIERKSYNNGTSYGSNNFLNNASSNSRSTSLDDVESMLMD